ncbi:TPA: hypothetical protein DCG86_01975 [Candidatus Marinimicrobia bacterium]|nr:MAG: hypothetical protein XD77_1275 [Marinimicrobia bacterium 46_47]KUK93335.1 MAG: hypothetical protein XE04_0274 [Marinimicrobia bacterium 46_43]HAE86772.1 hypothetical protein [Candidatus Neomarinimicrobiota bacterium]HBY18688.1 hypothetical protein [Candidatus Neomarinimicrobiota bacterium]
MNKKINFLILVLLFFWILLLLYRQKELSRSLLHADRSVSELLCLENLRTRYLLTSVDSLFETNHDEGLLLLINRDENLDTWVRYLETHFPAWPLTVVRNGTLFSAGSKMCETQIPFPELLDIPVNILCYYRRGTCRYFFLYEPANPWRLGMDIKVLRKIYEKSIEMACYNDGYLPDLYIWRAIQTSN